MSVWLSLVTMIFVALCGECPRGALSHVYAEPHDVSVDSFVPRAPLHTTHRALRSRIDRYRDPFVPKTVVRTEIPAPEPTQEAPSRQHVLVRGIMSSPQGRWALLEFENGERLIVRAGQVIAAFSQVVTRITDQGVTLSALGGKGDAPLPPDRTYLLDTSKE